MAVMVNGNVALYGATKVYGDVTVSALTGTNIAIADWNKKAIEEMEQKNWRTNEKMSLKLND